MAKIKKNNNNLSFEDSLNKAKEVVQKLESGDCSLDEMLLLYEDGIKSVKYCSKKLTEFEDKIKIISSNIENKIENDEIE